MDGCINKQIYAVNYGNYIMGMQVFALLHFVTLKAFYNKMGKENINKTITLKKLFPMHSAYW